MRTVIDTEMNVKSISMLARFFAACREWMAERLAVPYEDDWLAIWYPKSVAQMA